MYIRALFSAPVDTTIYPRFDQLDFNFYTNIACVTANMKLIRDKLFAIRHYNKHNIN